MKVVSVNVGQPQEVPWRGKTVRTSVYKTPVAGRVRVGKLNLHGDAQADLASHGGEHRAVMVYQAEAYQYWGETLGRKDFVYGQFGENLTVTGLADNEVCVGDRFLIGSAIFEVTQPRVTCWRVGISTGVPEMPALLVSHKRPGFYFRVIREGDIGAGDVIEKIKQGEEQMSVAEIDGLLYLKDHPEDKLQKALNIPALSQGWKGSFRSLLDAAQNGPAMGLPAWTGFRPFVVQSSRPECEGVRSFELSPGDGDAVPAFLPGQHIALRLYPTADGVPLTRLFSLCGSPAAPTLRIAVKREANGPGSSYLHDQVRNGDILGISAPRGTFTLSPSKQPLVLLSAGVGVTPLLSILYQVAREDRNRGVWWIHSCRNGAYQAFREKVLSLSLQLTAFHQVLLYSRPNETELLGRDYDSEGHLDLQLLQSLQLPLESEFYLCGPSGYMQSITAALTSLGIGEDQIRSERFGNDPVALGPGAKTPHLPPENTGQGPLVTFSKSKIAFRWQPRFYNLLEAAEACDVPVQWSCRMGVCHRCETGIIDGQVSYSPDPLDPPKPGNVLLCCSVPANAIDLDL
jgi:ferredoxin-NADP reductase/MOSC domain-containing protein YiiM